MEGISRGIIAEYTKLTESMRDVLGNKAGYENMKKYLSGLIGNAERKNGWQISEYVGASTPYALQQFIYRGRFSPKDLQDKLMSYVSSNLGEEDGALVIDETGFLKQGKHSCGVKRQYSGTAGRVENCQIGVFLTYAGHKGHSPIDGRLYMPKEWIEDHERRVKAGVPEDAQFQTKPQMALAMIRAATDAGMPYTWVTGDSVYGDYTDIRTWLEENGKCYVMSVSGKAYVWMGYKQASVGSILKNMPEEGWFEASCGDGSKGARLYDWHTVQINPGPEPGYERSILVRRSKASPGEMCAYVCYAPVGTPEQKLIEVVGCRWTIETCFKECKSYTGLDQYEVRSYDGWHKHIILACIALAFLTVISAHSLDTMPLQKHNPASSSLLGFKKGRNLRA